MPRPLSLPALACSALLACATASAQDLARPSAAEAAALFPTVPAPTAPLQPTASDAPLIARVTPSVVSVFPARSAEEPAADDPLSRYFNPPAAKTEGEEKNENLIQGVGSGVVVSPAGWIVTNSHVVHFNNGQLASAVIVELHDRRRFDATIVGVDKSTDLALLKIEATGLSALPIGDSDTLAVGDPVYAVGNPFRIGLTATKGMVSALRRTNLGIIGPGSYESFIQTDASINPGNSGGALINAHGQLVGINSAIYSGRGGNIGIGFAIPTNLARSVLTQLAEQGKVSRGFFGLMLTEVLTTDARAAGLEAVAGAKVQQVQPGSPAEKSGLASGDLIVEAQGKKIETKGDLRLALSLVRPGETLKLSYRRGTHNAAATLAATENASAAENSPTASATGEAASPTTIEFPGLPGLGLADTGSGLKVVTVPPAIATKTGFEAGWIISEVNGSTVNTLAELEAALRKGVNKVVTRQTEGDLTQTLAVRLP